MISQTAEYALRAAVALAATPQTALITAHIAAKTHVPPGYLAKVMQKLKQAGLVLSQRGVGGGFLLARPPDTITILDVIAAVDPIRRIRQCPLGLEAHHDCLCPLHRALDDALALLELRFAASSLADILNAPSYLRPLDLARDTSHSLNPTTSSPLGAKDIINPSRRR